MRCRSAAEAKSPSQHWVSAIPSEKYGQQVFICFTAIELNLMLPCLSEDVLTVKFTFDTSRTRPTSTIRLEGDTQKRLRPAIGNPSLLQRAKPVVS